MLARIALGLLYRVLPAREAYAHCDIPCGIYDPITAKIAAQTVLKMVMRIQSLPPPDPQKPETEVAYLNSLARYIAVKEHHAELCKRELDILWHDYFKPEHLAKYPDLHTLFWNTLKLASRCKQTVDRKAAEDLVAAVDRIAEVFWETKGIKYADPYAQARFGT